MRLRSLQCRGGNAIVDTESWWCVRGGARLLGDTFVRGADAVEQLLRVNAVTVERGEQACSSISTAENVVVWNGAFVGTSYSLLQRACVSV